MPEEQNSLVTVLAINEYSSRPGICLHMALGTGMSSSNIPEVYAFSVGLKYQSQ